MVKERKKKTWRDLLIGKTAEQIAGEVAEVGSQKMRRKRLNLMGFRILRGEKLGTSEEEVARNPYGDAPKLRKYLVWVAILALLGALGYIFFFMQ